MTFRPSERLPVFVSSNHIKKGKPGASTCPITVALLDQGSDTVSVLNDYAYIDGVRWWLSKRAQKFVLTFDDGDRVLPSKFVLWR